MAQETVNSIHRRATLEYLDTIDPTNPPTPHQIEEELLDKIKGEIELANSVRSKDDKIRLPQTLMPVEIAQIMARLHDICRVSCAGDNADADYDLLAMYQPDGVDKGIYTVSDDVFRQLARQYNYGLTAKEFTEVMTSLRDMVPRRRRCSDRDLIAVNNGIFDYSTKTLSPFTPEKVFLTKSRVDYNPSATNVVIHNATDGTDWDVESWMETLSDDMEIVNVLWEILGAIIRPNVRWNKSAWMYSEKGNNGKGTLCELMRNLCGYGSFTSIPIADFSKDFMLEPLTRASAIIVDENDVGTFIDKAANLKAVITNDVIQINRKFKTPIAYQFFGFMVQCLNEFPKIKDKSDSFYRRQLFIPMTKCFTGMERRYIKTDYLHRTDVLEYVMKRVLHMDYYTLSEPAACKDILDEYKEFNDPVRQYWDEFKDRFVWDLLPFGFLYDLYKEWFKRNSPSGGVLGKNTFVKDLLAIIKPSDGWDCPDKTAKIRSGSRIVDPEPLIIEYKMDGWMNPAYRGQDPMQKALPLLAPNYRGILRLTSSSGGIVTDEELDDKTASAATV